MGVAEHRFGDPASLTFNQRVTLRPRTGLLLLMFAVFTAGCAGRVREPAGGPGALSSEVAVDRFLQLVRAKDYVQMGWIFGTADGPIISRDPLADVERRMYALADVLGHETAVVGRGMPVPGRIGVAEKFEVQIRRADRMYSVPITSVRGSGRWYVEQVDIAAVTSQR